jgi:hypothetical protein
MARGTLATAPTTEPRPPASARIGSAASTATQRIEILVRRMIALLGPLERTTTLNVCRRFPDGDHAGSAAIRPLSIAAPSLL